jgi:hypothetical protein
MALDLSKKRHYTFPQAAFQLKCSEEDLRYFVMEGELTPSSFIGAGHLCLHQMQPHEDYGTTGHVYPRVKLDACSTDDVIERGWLSGFHYLVLPTRTSGNHCEFRFAAKFSTGFDLGDLIYELEAPVVIDEVLNSCFVMAVELDRFLAVQSKTKRSSEPDKPMTPRERNTYQNIIGGLLGLMLGKTPAGKPQSVFQNQSMVIAAMLGNYPDTPGVSDSNLEKYFAEANRSLKSN